MQRNKFNKRIEIWSLTQVSDGYGGYTLTEALTTSSWANLRVPNAGDNLQQFGITQQNSTVIFTVRFRQDLDYNVNNMFIKYRGLKYTIATNPTDPNFGDNFISFVGQAETVKSND